MKTPGKKKLTNQEIPTAALISHPTFVEGYMQGMDDPGYDTATQPTTIKNPYPKGEAHEAYELGYRAAIQ